MTIKKYVLLHDNMLNEDDLVSFSADIPYLIEDGRIDNGDDMIVDLVDIWVPYHFESEAEVALRTHRPNE